MKNKFSLLADFTRLFRYMEARTGDIRRGILTGIGNHLSAICAASLGAYAASLAAQGRPSHEIGYLIAFLSVLVAARAFFYYAEMFFVHRAAYGILADLRVRVYRVIERVAPAYLMGKRTGDMASLLMSDVETLEWFYAHTFGACFVALAVPLLTLGGLAFLHVLLPVVLLPWLIAMLSVPFWFGKNANPDGAEMRRALADVNAEVIDGIQGLKEILSFGYGSAYIQKLRKYNRALTKVQARNGRRMGLENGLLNLFMSLGLLSVLLSALLLVTGGAMGREWYPVAALLAVNIFLPVMEISRMARNFNVLQASARRVFAVLETLPTVTDTAQENPTGEYEKSVSFDDVTFRYADGLPDVLRNVSFRVRPGETVALVGHSGAGKSTCANLLLRFWDVKSGAVRIGPHDVRAFTQTGLRDLIAAVPQEIYLFNTTILDNIRLGRPGADEEDVIRAAKSALAHDFISAMPDGYRTVVGERGAQLSGGQRQRIAIARAFLRNAPVLLMDEALSNLDAENERLVHSAMGALKKGRTTVIIAHRLSTILTADRLVVLKDGKVAQIGTHEDLIRSDGYYRELIGTQHEQ
ncbi:MAG: ABC transporter ATP-binding protein/permease [Clostridiales Family XIII bacterium]|jgi:ATP-binding cassette subfamily B protein|nr:ABC transporter ATP-binding protein/permease [Clostridiales Family XIII bacterium]